MSKLNLKSSLKYIVVALAAAIIILLTDVFNVTGFFDTADSTSVDIVDSTVVNVADTSIVDTLK